MQSLYTSSAEDLSKKVTDSKVLERVLTGQEAKRGKRERAASECLHGEPLW